METKHKKMVPAWVEKSSEPWSHPGRDEAYGGFFLSLFGIALWGFMVVMILTSPATHLAAPLTASIPILAFFMWPFLLTVRYVIAREWLKRSWKAATRTSWRMWNWEYPYPEKTGFVHTALCKLAKGVAENPELMKAHFYAARDAAALLLSQNYDSRESAKRARIRDYL